MASQHLQVLCVLRLFQNVITVATVCVFWGRFRKIVTSFVTSVFPPVRMEHLGSQWMDFREVWYLCIFRKYVEKISLESDKTNRYLHEDLPCILESNPHPFYSSRGLKISDAD